MAASGYLPFQDDIGDGCAPGACSEHGIVTEAVPLSELGSGFTVLFEALVD